MKGALSTLGGLDDSPALTPLAVLAPRPLARSTIKSIKTRVPLGQWTTTGPSLTIAHDWIEYRGFSHLLRVGTPLIRRAELAIAAFHRICDVNLPRNFFRVAHSLTVNVEYEKGRQGSELL